VLESKPGDRIVFAPELSGQTLFLPHGEITIDGEVNIDASELEEGIRISGNGRSRIFAIEQTAVVTLDSLSLIDGKAPLDGGAMVTAGIVTVRRCTFSGNRAGDEGGAIYADVGVLTVENSTFYQNSAHVSGGGVYLKTGKFSATNCTFAENSCGCSGGAVIVLGGTLTLDHCTIAGNTANTQGREFQAGGLYFSSGASGHLSHSVVAGNSAFNDNQVQVTAGTLVQTQNFTSGDPMLAPLGDYGGPTRTMPPLLGSPVIDSAVDTGNLPATDQRGLPRKVGPRVDLGATEGSYAPAAPLAVTRQASDLAPQTATLHGRVTANGAETTCYFEYGTTMDYGLSLPPQTLTAGSVEVDARPAGLSEDTVYHYRLVATNRLGTRFGEDRSFRTTRERVVRNVDDGGADSLRDVVANADPGDVIVFASSLGGQVIRLTKGKIVLDKNLTIDASALANGMVIDGDGPVSESRIFEISPGITSTMVGLTLTNGFAVGGYPENSGGAILLWRDSFLTLDRCTLVGNRSSASGGAILIVYGTLVIDNCTLMRNQGEHGGAIRNSEGTLIIRNSTLTQNEARDWGGAIYRFAGNFTIENSTLTRNTAKEGGALYNYTGRLTLTNSIVANNTATKSNTDIVGEFTGTNNLTSSDPMLAPLGDYGGPTRTMPPLPGSPAIDAGSDTGNLSATDQRGFSRMVGAQVDIGAVEVQSDLAPESLTPPR
jgi:predicted outer membrane repeat protein